VTICVNQFATAANSRAFLYGYLKHSVIIHNVWWLDGSWKIVVERRNQYHRIMSTYNFCREYCVLSLFSHCRFKVVNDEVSDYNTIVNVYIILSLPHTFFTRSTTILIWIFFPAIALKCGSEHNSFYGRVANSN